MLSRETDPDKLPDLVNELRGFPSTRALAGRGIRREFGDASGDRTTLQAIV